MNETEAAAVCRALADPGRLRIVQTLRGGELCACRLLEQFSFTQPTLSHHMKALADCGLVETRREGRWCHYTLNCETLSAFRAFIENLRCCESPEADA